MLDGAFGSSVHHVPEGGDAGGGGGVGGGGGAVDGLFSTGAEFNDGDLGVGRGHGGHRGEADGEDGFHGHDRCVEGFWELLRLLFLGLSFAVHDGVPAASFLALTDVIGDPDEKFFYL